MGTNTNSTGKYKGQGREWAKGGKNAGWTTGRGYVVKPAGPPVRLICIVCQRAVQSKNKKCLDCNKGASK
jgi:hypothetical protein